jgi:hypothetical protein
MPVSDQNHGRVPVPPTARLAGGIHQAFDLGLGEILAINSGKNGGWRRLPEHQLTLDLEVVSSMILTLQAG